MKLFLLLLITVALVGHVAETTVVTGAAALAVGAGIIAIKGGFALGAAKGAAARSRGRGRRSVAVDVDAAFATAANTDVDDCLKKLICILSADVSTISVS
jgi:hypothetical protein